MFEKNNDNEMRINLIYGLFTQYSKGQRIPHLELIELAGCSPPEDRYYRLLRAARRRFRRDTGIYIREVMRFGFELCTDDQVTYEVMPRIDRQRSRKRDFQIALLRDIPETASEHVREIAAFRLVAMIEDRKRARADAAQLNELMKPSRVNPKMLPFPREGTG